MGCRAGTDIVNNGGKREKTPTYLSCQPLQKTPAIAEIELQCHNCPTFSLIDEKGKNVNLSL
jgi:hypothetical protein